MPTAQTNMVTTVTDSAGNTLTMASNNTYNLGTGNAAVDQEVVLTNGVFTALTVPAGSNRVRIRTNGGVSLVLKGVTGDTGIPITLASSALADDIYLTLGPSPTLGLLNNGAAPVTIRVLWQ